jgi:hypothetical protein
MQVSSIIVFAHLGCVAAIAFSSCESGGVQAPPTRLAPSNRVVQLVEEGVQKAGPKLREFLKSPDPAVRLAAVEVVRLFGRDAHSLSADLRAVASGDPIPEIQGRARVACVARASGNRTTTSYDTSGARSRSTYASDEGRQPGPCSSGAKHTRFLGSLILSTNSAQASRSGRDLFAFVFSRPVDELHAAELDAMHDCSAGPSPT